ncbi:alpha/beta hydrolase [Limnohabitans sp.]|uniref:alpha/beta fold hydrolase n=1 Tax=Limnohabitans sp. TaxID=1907725 RepID=UPI00286F8926|nr:alpha/beta hydrolase [Limnohabitans sp.]
MSDIYSVQLSDGPGFPVVVSHALGLDHSMWSGWIDAQKGQRPILAYDHRGQGRSKLGVRPIDLGLLVEDAATLVNEWKRGPVVFVGLSQGGMVAQGLAIRHPTLVRGLVLAHTVANYAPAAQAAWRERIATVEQRGISAVVDLISQRYLSEDFRATNPQVTDALRAQILSNDAKAYVANCQAVANVNWLNDLKLIKSPTLVLAGALDMGATPMMAEAIHHEITGSQLEIFEHASHLSPLEQPEKFQRAVSDFLNSL